MSPAPSSQSDAEAARNPLRYRARVPSSQIGYIQAIVESHEGLCMVRTRNPRLGLIEFWVSRKFKRDFDRLIEGLRDEMPVEIEDRDPDDWSDFQDSAFVKHPSAGAL